VTIEADIIDWALQRPAWQQEVLVALASGERFGTDEIAALVDQLLEPGNGQPNQEAKKISIKSTVTDQVQLKEISGVHGVNALVDGETLSLAALGMTVVYGDNGSGKSGYARLIKSMVSARHVASVLPDVFSTNPEAPSAVLTYTVAGTEKMQSYPAAATPVMLKMSFYDKQCGEEYLTKQSTISYRPSALTLLDGLIETCDRLRAAVQERIRSNQETSLNLGLSPQTTAGAFVTSLTSKTTNDQIDAATTLAPGTSERLAAVLQDEARLTVSNPEREKARLGGLATQFTNLRSGLTNLLNDLSTERTAERTALQSKANELRAAATLAASESFDAEPLDGVGSETWRALWNAARNYSVAEAYHDHAFPVTDDDAVCVFCQQPLGDTAKDRLRRFDQYMTDTTERDAQAAERAFESSVREVRDVAITTPQRSAAVTALTSLDAKLGGAVEALLAKLEEHRDAVLSHLVDESAVPAELPIVDVPEKIAELAATLQARADATDLQQFRIALAATTKEKEELQANIRLSESADALKADVVRRQKLAALQAAKSATDTNAITQKASQLSRQYATKQILDQFTRETERLKLEKVTLEDLGGHKGQLSQRPGLLGAHHKGATARSVLSEGEQTALGLAGFFTEAMFDESKSAIIFDDPVTSLDHVRRDKAAERLAQLARDRQVVVFTHDVVFTGDLVAAAESEGVQLTERSVERRGSKPGVCLLAFPWKAKDFKSRIDHLTTELVKLKKDRPTLVQDDYEERVASWAGYLSETWERSVTTEIMNQVFDRGTSEVRVKKFRMLTKITETDNQDFQDGYSHTSKWARRHDKAPGTNYVAPEPADLEVELKRLVDWQKRMKTYV
jgi:energy-coupling factor transporter ATP-binding protein EcfA2